MFENLRQFIADVVSPDATPELFDDTGYRLAATALLIHVVSLQGAPSPIELQKLHELIERGFKLDPGTADRLIAAATVEESDSVDLYHFTSVILRTIDEAGRLKLIGMMWELVYADGHVTEFEDNVVWRAADLLGISASDRVELRRRAASTPDGVERETT